MIVLLLENALKFLLDTGTPTDTNAGGTACEISLKSGSGAAEGVETAHTEGAFAQALFP